MNLLFLHPNMPGQFKHLCRKFAEDSNNQVVFVTKPKKGVIPGVRKIEYQPQREPQAPTHRYIIGLERGILCGQEVWRHLKKLKAEGFVPDVAVAHPGWGDALFLKDVYPDTPLLSFFEFYYHTRGGDVNFDPNDPITEDDKARIRIKNSINLFNLEAMDWGFSPTWWQWSLHPKEFRDRISVIHDGVDTQEIAPVEEMELQMQSGITLSKKDEVVTYVARNFEPYRGFPTAMRAFKIIQERRPNCHIIAIGGDEISYGKRPPAGKTYRQMMMEEVQGLDMSRLHFTGHLKYNVFLNVLKISRAHLYLTYPFVLSWSALEAMSAGCVVIGSDTEPVREVIEDGKNGLLVDFFSPEGVADRVDEVLDHKNFHQQIRDNARKTVIERYDTNLLLPLHMQLVEDLANRKFPPPAAKKIMNLYPDPPFQLAA